MYLWDARKTKKPLAKFKDHMGVVRSVDFINDDKWLVSSNLEGEIIVHDIGSGDVVAKERVLGSYSEDEGCIAYAVRPLR